jgi:hypothetical protein
MRGSSQEATARLGLGCAVRRCTAKEAALMVGDACESEMSVKAIGGALGIKWRRRKALEELPSWHFRLHTQNGAHPTWQPRFDIGAGCASASNSFTAQ